MQTINKEANPIIKLNSISILSLPLKNGTFSYKIVAICSNISISFSDILSCKKAVKIKNIITLKIYFIIRFDFS